MQESSLGVFRWIFGLFLFLFLTPYFGWIPQVPNAFFNPPYLSGANLFSQFPGELFFYCLDIAIIIGILLLTLGIKARWSSFVLLICWLVGNSFKYSFGKIDHGIMPLIVLLCMIFSNWGAYYALVPDKLLSPYFSRKALALLSVLLAFGMFTAGFGKSLNWVDFDFNTSGFLSWFYQGYYDLNRTSLLAPTVLYLPKWIFEFADYAAVFFELSAFVALLISRKWWLLWLFTACLFHLSNVLLLNITFIGHFIVYLAFVDFSQIIEQAIGGRRHSIFQFRKSKYFLLGCAFSLFLAHFLQRIYGRSLNFSPESELFSSVGIWFIAAIVIASDLVFSKHETKKVIK